MTNDAARDAALREEGRVQGLEEAKRAVASVPVFGRPTKWGEGYNMGVSDSHGAVARALASTPTPPDASQGSAPVVDPYEARRLKNAPGLYEAIRWVDHYLGMELGDAGKALLDDLRKRLVHEMEHGQTTSTLMEQKTGVLGNPLLGITSPLLRCKVTTNMCGTDTWMAGSSCQCVNCQEWLRLIEAARATAPPAAPQGSPLPGGDDAPRCPCGGVGAQPINSAGAWRCVRCFAVLAPRNHPEGGALEGEMAEALRSLVFNNRCSRLLCDEDCRCDIGRGKRAVARYDASKAIPQAWEPVFKRGERVAQQGVFHGTVIATSPTNFIVRYDEERFGTIEYSNAAAFHFGHIPQSGDEKEGTGGK